MEFEEVLPRRSLKEGRWDKILKARMIELSVADNYDDCKHEWIVTGETWYIPFVEEAGMVLPDYHNVHAHECLCGHPIVWHFEIENTENGHKDIVGSEHIESYMVIRHLEAKGIDPTTITEDMIDKWVSEQIKSLKAKWWWDLHGEQFEEWFAHISDLDLRVNVRPKGRRWDYSTRQYENEHVIRKRAEGKFGQPGYKMASIVWRWNHEDNTRNQRDGRGYPNERLWNDLQMFYITAQRHITRLNEEDEKRAARLELLKEQERINELARQERLEASRIFREEARQRREKNDAKEAELDGAREQKRLNRAIAARINNEGADEKFSDACEYYDIPTFSAQLGHNDWERTFLSDMITQLSDGKDLSEAQLNRLRKIVIDEPLPATDKQIWYIKKLAVDGYTPPEGLTRTEASILINELKGGE